MHSATTRAAAAALAVLAAAGCRGDGGTEPPPPPQPGTLAVHFVTPNTGDRAARIAVRGGPVTAVRAEAGDVTVHAAPDGAGALVIAVGPLATGVVARLDVPDVNQQGRYTAAVVDVADERYALRPDGLPGYAATVQR